VYYCANYDEDNSEIMYGAAAHHHDDHPEPSDCFTLATSTKANAINFGTFVDYLKTTDVSLRGVDGIFPLNQEDLHLPIPEGPKWDGWKQWTGPANPFDPNPVWTASRREAFDALKKMLTGVGSPAARGSDLVVQPIHYRPEFDYATGIWTKDPYAYDGHLDSDGSVWAEGHQTILDGEVVVIDPIIPFSRGPYTVRGDPTFFSFPTPPVLDLLYALIRSGCLGQMRFPPPKLSEHTLTQTCLMQTPGGTDLSITISTELTQTTVTFKRLNWEGTYSYWSTKKSTEWPLSAQVQLELLERGQTPSSLQHFRTTKLFPDLDDDDLVWDFDRQIKLDLFANTVQRLLVPFAKARHHTQCNRCFEPTIDEHTLCLKCQTADFRLQLAEAFKSILQYTPPMTSILEHAKVFHTTASKYVSTVKRNGKHLRAPNEENDILLRLCWAAALFGTDFHQYGMGHE